MITNLPQWYRIAAINNISEETLEKRSLAIAELIENSDENFYFDCVRLYLGKKPIEKEFNDTFFNAFNGKDGLFLQDAPLLEKQILAGAVIAQWFSENEDFGVQLAYLLVSASFGIATADIINSDIVESAWKYLRNRAEIERITPPVAPKAPTFKEEAPTAENIPAYIKSISTYAKGIATYTERMNRNNQKRIERLQEESDIHWWLFRSFSNTKGISISELPSEVAPFILAYELSKLITIVPAPGNTISFLNKSLKDVNELPDKYSIKKAAEILSQLNVEIAIGLDGEKYGNLTPLAFAVSKIAEADGDDAWLGVYKLNAKIDAEKEFTIEEIAFQFFNELILLSI